MASHSGQAVSAERRKRAHLRDPSTTRVAALGREIAQSPESGLDLSSRSCGVYQLCLQAQVTEGAGSA